MKKQNNKNIIHVYPYIANKIVLNSDNKCTNAFLLCTEPETLRIAYEMMKSNPGNMVQGTDKETLDGISES